MNEAEKQALRRAEAKKEALRRAGVTEEYIYKREMREKRIENRHRTEDECIKGIERILLDDGTIEEVDNVKVSKSIEAKRDVPKYVYKSYCSECKMLFDDRAVDYCPNCGKKNESKKLMDFIGFEIPSKEMKDLADRLAKYFDVTVKVYSNGTEIVASLSSRNDFTSSSYTDEDPHVTFRFREIDWETTEETWKCARFHEKDVMVHRLYSRTKVYQNIPRSVDKPTRAMLRKFCKWNDCTLTYYYRGFIGKDWIAMIVKNGKETKIAILF